MSRSLFFIIFLLFGFLSSAQAHFVTRTIPAQFIFSIQDNQSGLQDQDVQILFWILDQHYKKKISNSEINWTQGYDWSNSYMGAGAQQNGNEFSVMLWGGFVRARFMHLGILAATLCHEIGHKLGGEPFQKFPGSDPHWSSAEGQSDHFAATDCLPKVFESLKNFFPYKLNSIAIENFSIQHCKTSQTQEQCRWVTQSGIDFVEFLQTYYELDIPLARPEIWAREKVEKTLFTAYPTYQCRMDIFKSAALDPKSPRLSCWYAHPLKNEGNAAALVD